MTPFLPVMVIVYVPAVVVAFVVTVSVLFVEPFAGGVTLVGNSLQVMPFVLQAPDAVRPTAAWKPPDEVTVIVEVGEPGVPAVVLSVVGLAKTLKPVDPPLTCSVTIAEWVVLPLVPVTVTV